ncbi:hypothetical protein, partial [Victivallis vadensis]|uniref:hypothetical protein n=1 Tax=Victivallis vadensis TaxID=172901 RepID=UPI00266D95B3
MFHRICFVPMWLEPERNRPIAAIDSRHLFKYGRRDLIVGVTPYIKCFAGNAGQVSAPPVYDSGGDFPAALSHDIRGIIHRYIEYRFRRSKKQRQSQCR